MKNKKILFCFVIISILAFCLEVKMNNQISNQEKVMSLRKKYDKKHITTIKLKRKDSFTKDKGILYTEKDRNKTVKIFCKESGILSVEMNEYDNMKNSLPTGKLTDAQNKQQKIMPGNPNFGYSYLVRVKKGTEYNFKILSKAENLILKANLLNDNVKKIKEANTYIQSGKGKEDEKIINLDRVKCISIETFINTKKKNVDMKILKKKGKNWVKEKEMKVVINKKIYILI